MVPLTDNGYGTSKLSTIIVHDMQHVFHVDPTLMTYNNIITACRSGKANNFMFQYPVEFLENELGGCLSELQA